MSTLPTNEGACNLLSHFLPYLDDQEQSEITSLINRLDSTPEAFAAAAIARLAFEFRYLKHDPAFVAEVREELSGRAGKALAAELNDGEGA